MRTGVMRDRLRVVSITAVTDSTGAESRSERTEYEHIPAERVRLTGQMSYQADERFPDYHAEWNIRMQIRLQEHWQVTDLSTGYRYEVTNITPNRTRGYKTIVCERINE